MNSRARNQIHIENGTKSGRTIADGRDDRARVRKVEQRPAPCCRASLYCTDPVYTAATTMHNDGDLPTSTIVVVDAILPRFLLASHPFFPVLVSGAPSRTTRSC